MRSKSQRATSIWLIIIGLLLSLVFISGAVPPQVQLIGLVLYAAMALAALGVFDAEEVRRRLPRRPSLDVLRVQRPRWERTQASDAARRAQQRASLLSDYLDDFRLLDVGLIVSEVGPDGMSLRRGEVTLDDQAIQPYVVLHADPSWNDETVSVRFEILDTHGEPHFRYEDKVYLREGQNNVLCSRRLPLGDKAATVSPGLWELRVSVDGGVIGLHSFGVGPSLRERQRMFEEGIISPHRRERLRDAAADEDDDSPISLEELLRGRE